MRLRQGQVRGLLAGRPRQLEELCGDYTTAADKRVFQAMLRMGRIDVAGLRAAHDAA